MHDHHNSRGLTDTAHLFRFSIIIIDHIIICFFIIWIKDELMCVRIVWERARERARERERERERHTHTHTQRERLCACVVSILNVFVCKQIIRIRPWTACRWWMPLTSGAVWTPALAPSRAARDGSTPTHCPVACPPHPRNQVPLTFRTLTIATRDNRALPVQSLLNSVFLI